MTTQHVVSIEGLPQFYARLAQLQGEKLAKTAQTATSKGLKETVVPAVKQAASENLKGHGHGPNHGPAGRLIKAINARVIRKRPGEMFAIAVGPAGKRGNASAWYAKFVIRGTKAHLITPGGQGGGAYSSFVRHANRGNAKALLIAGRLASIVHHPGARADPFIRAGIGKEDQLNAQLIRDLIAASKGAA